MSGRERISDKDIAEWIKEVEEDTSAKGVASNPKPPEQAPKPNGRGGPSIRQRAA